MVGRRCFTLRSRTLRLIRAVYDKRAVTSCGRTEQLLSRGGTTGTGVGTFGRTGRTCREMRTCPSFTPSCTRVGRHICRTGQVVSLSRSICHFQATRHRLRLLLSGISRQLTRTISPSVLISTKSPFFRSKSSGVPTTYRVRVSDEKWACRLEDSRGTERHHLNLCLRAGRGFGRVQLCPLYFRRGRMYPIMYQPEENTGRNQGVRRSTFYPRDKDITSS